MAAKRSTSKKETAMGKLAKYMSKKKKGPAVYSSKKDYSKAGGPKKKFEKDQILAGKLGKRKVFEAKGLRGLGRQRPTGKEEFKEGGSVYSSKKDYSKAGGPKGLQDEYRKKVRARREATQKRIKEERAAKKAGKTWTKAVKKQKKKGEAGVTLSSLVSKRKGLKKGTAEYAAVQNKINKAYGVKKRHKATVPSPKPIGQSYETAEASKPTPSGPESPVGKKEYEAKPGQKSTMYDTRPKAKEGGLVESNPFGWPSRDARNGGKG